MGIPVGDMRGAVLPDAVVLMVATRRLNQWLGSSYDLQSAADLLEQSPLLYEMFSAFVAGMTPPKG